MYKLNSLILGLVFLFPSLNAYAGGRSEAGLTLLETPSARASSLGEAFSAVTDDISGLNYNPSSLSSLFGPQASLSYQKGLADDSFGYFAFGSPVSFGHLGILVGHYDGGEVDVFDGTTIRNITSQEDMLAGLGYSTRLHKLSLGLTAKYFSSEIAETSKASAVLGDVGLQYVVFSRMTLGASLQNFGQSLKFESKNNDLPRLARAGFAYQLVSQKVSTLFGKGIYQWMVYADGVAHLNTNEIDPAVGLEITMGPLAMRAGHNGGSDLQDFNLGAGFHLGPAAVDYAFGLVDEFDSTHRVSLSYRFGSPSQTHINEIEESDEGFRLLHPDYLIDFEDQGVLFIPKKGPEWKWNFSHMQYGEKRLDVSTHASTPQVNRNQHIVYHRGLVEEIYIPKENTVEQQFIFPQPIQESNEDVIIVGQIQSKGKFRKTQNGWHWTDQNGSVQLGDVTVFDADKKIIPATMMVRADQTQIVIDGPSLSQAKYPVVVDPEIGTNDFRISDMGPDGNLNFDALQPAIAYNSTNNEFLVVWVGDDSPDNNFEIFAQRIDGTTGGQLGTNDIKVSDLVPDGLNPSDLAPAVAYNSTNDEYLVVWEARVTAGVDEFEIFGQRLSGGTGAEVGTNDFRISDMGPDGNVAFAAMEPSVTYNATQNEYLVVWVGDDVVDEDRNIYGQRLNAATGAEVGTNDFLIGDGVDDTAVTFNSTNNEYLVVWQGQVSPLVSDFEIYGQRLDGTNGAELGADDFRISDMGPEGDSSPWWGIEPDVAYNPTVNEYLVVWQGDDVIGLLNYEIHAQRINAATGAEVGTNDFKISEMSATSDLYLSFHPSVVYNPNNQEYFVVWYGNKDIETNAIAEYEIYGQRLNGATGAEIGDDDFRLSDMGPPDDIDYPAQNPHLSLNSSQNHYFMAWEGSDDVVPLVKGEFEIFGQMYAPFRILSIAPNLDNISGGDTVTVTGTDFIAGTTLEIGGQAATNVSVLNSTTLTAVVPPNTAGVKDVVVQNPDTAKSILANGFTYKDVNLQFKSALYEVGEGDGQATITLERLGEITGAVSVDYASTNGTASAGSDYTGTSGTVNWAHNDNADKSFTIDINDDTDPEGVENLFMTLSNPTGGSAITGPNPAQLDILDNENVFRFEADSLSITEAPTNLDVVVQFFGTPDGGGASITIGTQDGSALDGEDYTQTNQVLTWNKGDAINKQFSIPILDDDIFEFEEQFFAQLSNPSAGNWIGGTNPLPITILNDEEAAGTLNLTGDPEFEVRENKGDVKFRISRTVGLRGFAQISARIVEITAKKGEDYLFADVVINIPQGVNNGMFDAKIINDTAPELVESFRVELHSPVFEFGGGTLGSQSSQIVSINSDDLPEFKILSLNKVAAKNSLELVTVPQQPVSNLVVHWGRMGLDPSIEIQDPRELETKALFNLSGSYEVPLYASVGYEFDQVGSHVVNVTNLAAANLPPSRNLFNTSKNETAEIQVVLENTETLSVIIYDRFGREIIELVNEDRAPGFYSVIWNGRDADGEEVAPGVYLALIKEGNNTRTLKVIAVN